jgi:hypothetical protein
MAILQRYQVHVYHVYNTKNINDLPFGIQKRLETMLRVPPFIPFILETGGRVNKAARDWLHALTAPEPGEQVPTSQDDHPWNLQTRTTTETVLREAMQALVRVQAHMLARIVVEIRAADIPVELEPY